MKKRIAGLLKRLPFFWQLFLLMSFMVVAILAFHTVSNRLYENQLSTSYLEQTRLSLNRNCNSVFQEMRMTYAIPVAIEGNKNFDYIRSVTNGSLPAKYRSVLPLISKALRNQLYLRGNSLDTLLYLSGANSICGRLDVSPVAEAYFENYLCYTETSHDEIMALLRARGTTILLPMEEVIVTNSDNRVPLQKQVLTLINHPMDSSIAVLSLYEEEQLLTDLGFYDLPVGSALQIAYTTGDMLYTTALSEHAEYHSISCTDDTFGVVVTVLIPDNYFGELVSETKRSGLLLTALIAVLSFLLCVMISRMQSKPLQKLLTDYGSEEETSESKNEILHLNSILMSRKNEVEALNIQLIRNDLSRVFSGAVLMEKDEHRLAQWLGSETDSYRLAVLNTWEKEQALSPDASVIPEGFLAVSVDMTTMGLLFADSEENLERLQQLLDYEGDAMSCGVSARMRSLSNLNIAARQAYLSVPQNSGIGIYTEGSSNLQTLSWLQHERLYQSILMNDEEGARQLLQKLQQNQQIGSTAKETFFCCCFVIYSAAEELGVPFAEMERLNYDSGRSARHNLEQLSGLAEIIFRKMEKKRKQYHDVRQEQIMTFVEDHCMDYDFCAATVAEQFKMPEKSVYTLIRQMREKTFGEHILELRMKKAASLLCKTRESVERIAEQCGYPVHSTFYRAFRRYYGCTPNQYRSGADTGKSD